MPAALAALEQEKDMLRLFCLTALVGVASAQAADAHPINPDVLVEDNTMAHRSVAVTREELADPAALVRIERKLRSAARAACAEQYPSEGEYLFVTACVYGSLEDSLDEVRALETRTAGGTAHAIAVNVRSR